jgi:hypothetical protein
LEAQLLKNNVKDIEDLMPEWNELCDEGPSNDPFLRPEWFAAFARNFGQQVELVTVRHDGRLRAVLPVTSIRGPLHGLPVNKLEAVFNLNSPRFDLIHGADESERSAVVQAIWSKIRGRRDWTIMEMRLVKKDSWINSLIEVARADSFLTGMWEMDGAPFISLTRGGGQNCSINDYLKQSKKQLRQQLDRRKRRLSEAGRLDFVITDVYSAELLDRFFEIESRGWKGRQGTDVMKDPRVLKLHHETAKAASDRNDLLIYELRLDDKTIAMILGIKCSTTMFYWKTTYDETYSRFSPGNILFKMFLADCLQRKVDEIDLLSPSTENKRYWTSSEHEHAAFYIFKPGIAGKFFWFWKFGIAARLRKLRSFSIRDLVPMRLQENQ